MINPEISVIMPAYNSEQYIKQAISSILNQTFKNFELIIINDGSTDNTEHIIKQIKDKRIVLLSNSHNKGIPYSLNRGIERARGTYIARMDADDTCSNIRLSLELKFLKDNPKIDIVYTDMNYIDGNNQFTGFREYNHKNFHKTIRMQTPIAHATILCKTSVLQSMGGYTIKGAEDYDLWIRMYLKGFKFGHMPYYLYDYRKRTDKKIKKQLGFAINVKINAMKKYGFKLGIIGHIRLFIDKCLMLVPEKIITMIYKLVYVK